MNYAHNYLKITIPEPFIMTIRDEMGIKFHSKRNDADSRNENLKQFRAKPIPANTFVPMYEKMAREAEVKRQKNRQERQCEMLLRMKPFSFSESPSTLRYRSSSSPSLSNICEKTEPKFKANPMPKSLFSTGYDEKLKENEFLRKLKMDIRSQKMLQISKFPESIQKHAEMQKQRQMKQLADATTAIQLQCKIYEKAQKPHIVTKTNCNFNKEKSQSISHKKCPQVEKLPLKFKKKTIASIPAIRPHTRPNSAVENRAQAATPDPVKILRPNSTLSIKQMIEPKMTNTSSLRQKYARNYLENQRESQIDEIKQEYLKELCRTISWKSYLNTVHLNSENQEERLKRLKKEDKIRMQEYNLEIQEMYKRVQQRKLLMDMQSENNLIKQVEKHIKEKLQKEGVNEEIISKCLKDKSTSKEKIESDESEEDYENADDTENRSSVASEVSESESEDPSNYSLDDQNDSSSECSHTLSK